MITSILSDPIFLVLGTAAIILAALWLRTRDRRYAKGLAVVAALFVAYLLWQRFGPESVARQMERKLLAMEAALNRRDLDGIFEHVSEDFKLGAADKKMMRNIAKQATDSGDATEVVLSNFKPEKAVAPQPGEKAMAAIAFFGKVKSHDAEILFRCVAQFVRDPDGEWRLQSFKLYPFGGGTDEYHPPQIPYR